MSITAIRVPDIAIIHTMRYTPTEAKGFCAKLENTSDVEAFFEAVDQCKGKIELVSPEGDRVNLKSKLFQYLSVTSMCSNRYIRELESVAHEKEDTDRSIELMLSDGNLK